MGDIDRIDAARGGMFEFQHEGVLVAVPPPTVLTYQQVLLVLSEARYIATEVSIPAWKRERLRDAWAARYDLPRFDHARRLCYLVDRYSGAITYDLRAYAGVDLLDLWHGRRWQTLLDLIDRLPGHSAYAVAVSKDEEHSKMLAEALASREEGDQEPSGPSLASWTPEVDVLTALRDDVRVLTYAVRASGGDTNAKPPAPLPRPANPMQTALKGAEFARRQASHQSLVDRLLPHKRK